MNLHASFHTAQHAIDAEEITGRDPMMACELWEHPEHEDRMRYRVTIWGDGVLGFYETTYYRDLDDAIAAYVTEMARVKRHGSWFKMRTGEILHRSHT